MARARNIKPTFFQNEELAELTALERLAFIGMWTIADFKGCIELRPKRLKIQLLPYDNCNFEEIVTNLDKSGFISIYSVQGQRYLKIINFEKHQTPHKNERDAGSEIPDLPAQGLSNENLLKENKDLADFGNKTEKIGTKTDFFGTTRAESLILNPESLNLNPSKNIHDKKFNFENELIALNVDKLVLRDWLKVRKNKKASNTHTSLKNFLVEVEKTGLSVSDAVALCAGRSWAGLKADWVLNDKPKIFATGNFKNQNYREGVAEDGTF